jgi:repressor LexA
MTNATNNASKEMKAATPRQNEALDAIRALWKKLGYAPTYKEIADEMGLRSCQSIVTHLRLLEKKGLITRTPGTQRTVRVVGDAEK